MAQIALSQAGASLGAALLPNGLSFLGAGISGAVIGQALGGLAGGAIDGALFGRRAEGPRRSGLQIMESREGAGIPLVYGRYRVGGQVIWAARFKESRETRSAGKGGPRTTEYSYSVSFAVAVGQGVVNRIDKAWANGEPLALGDLAYRFYRGGEDQAPDPLIEAIEGEGLAPAYRGVAYLVFEDLPLDRFGGRLPQLSFEIVREPPSAAGPGRLKPLLKSVNLIPASGEFVYGTELVSARRFPAIDTPQNMNNGDGRADFLVALDQMEADLPAVDRVALTVGWFGDDLRAGECRIRPGVELTEKTTTPYGWRAGGVGRSGAYLISKTDAGGPNYGGTPADRCVVQAIQEMNARGLAVTMSPFLFMDVPPGNGLPDLYGGAEQAPFPWRGRIRPAAADGSAAAGAEVTAFLGAAAVGDFSIAGQEVDYHGTPDDWGFRRFILHHAWLAKAAGGVEAFLLGSEMVRIAQARGAGGTFPFVGGLKALAADVRALLGPAVKISYAADWTEYGAYVPEDGSGDVLFPLDALWGDPNVDFVGVDWYPPAGDWRDGPDHLDALAGYEAADDPAYLADQMAAGEAYDYFYANQADRDAQIRTPIVDTAYGEHWVFRQKDLAGWHGAAHHERPGGVRSASPTDWVPGSKPVRLSEIGFPAVDKGANSPNLFYDPKSSESALPPYSNGGRDDVLQRRALEAALSYWQAQPFVDAAHVWAWDARPWPDFPSRLGVWSDGGNWAFGHWLNGRIGLVELSDAAADLAERGGVTMDASDLGGLVEGYTVDGVTTVRRALEPLRTAFGFDAVERDGVLVLRDAGGTAAISAADTLDNGPRFTRQALDKTPGALRLEYLDATDGFRPAVIEARGPGDPRQAVDAATPLALSETRAAALAERLLAFAGETGRASLALPGLDLVLEPGDRAAVVGKAALWAISALADEGGARRLSLAPDRGAPAARFVEAPAAGDPAFAFGAPELVVIDPPLLPGSSAPDRPLLAAAARPWPGAARISAGPDASALTERAVLTRPAVVGRLISPLPAGPVGRIDRAGRIDVEAPSADFASIGEAALLSGGNALLLEGEDGWELLQFQTAEILDTGVFRLTNLLRGQQGGPAAAAPVGARCVLVDAALVRADFTAAELGLERVWRAEARGRFGEAETLAFENVAGLSWSPAHLRAVEESGGLRLSWIRRGADVDDSWTLPDAPNEGRFRVEALAGGAVVRAVELDAPEWLYAEALSDGADAVRVAEIGPDLRVGRFAEIAI